jgi:hypothetical protein
VVPPAGRGEPRHRAASIVIRAESRLARGIRDDRNRILSVLTRALHAKDDVRTPTGADAQVLGLLSGLEADLEAKQAASARNFGLAHLWLQLSTFGTASGARRHLAGAPRRSSRCWPSWPWA